MSFAFSKHALEQIAIRGISPDEVLRVLEYPDQIIPDGPDKSIFQAILLEDAKPYLIRVVVNTSKLPNLIVTAYKTSKIEKYLDHED